MSFYSSFEGTIKFNNKKDAEKALKILDQGWLSEDFTEEKKELFLEKRELTFPDCITTNDGSRNLHRVINALIEIGFKGKLLGTSTDGCFEGYIIIDGVEQDNVNLDEWAKTNAPDLYMEAPKNYDGDWDEYCEYQNEIINQWLETNG